METRHYKNEIGFMFTVHVGVNANSGSLEGATIRPSVLFHVTLTCLLQYLRRERSSKVLCNNFRHF